ncbi:uncharacterized protein DS421_16g543430 [Arachis hypogaea]|nr:uncharacterized protein DS421_16g543430 [Arachis hypogaea]
MRRAAPRQRQARSTATETGEQNHDQGWVREDEASSTATETGEEHHDQGWV